MFLHLSKKLTDFNFKCGKKLIRNEEYTHTHTHRERERERERENEIRTITRILTEGDL